MSVTHFEFTIDTRRLLRNVPLPNRMSLGVKDMWTTWNKNRVKIVLTQRRGGEKTKHKVELKDVVWGDGRVETFLCKGWEDFVTSNNLEVEDLILLTLENYVNMVYRVRIWRDDIEITGTEVGSGREEEDPYFEFQFLHSYVFKPTINVPLKFAKAQLNHIVKETKVAFYMNTTKYEATMHIRRDSKNRIISCNLKKGVQNFLLKEDVQENEKVRVELWNPNPIFNIFFI